jgi:hypothetical protein
VSGIGGVGVTERDAGIAFVQGRREIGSEKLVAGRKGLGKHL